MENQTNAAAERIDENSALRQFFTGPNRAWWQIPAILVVAAGTAASLYHLYVPIVGAYETFFLRPLHLLLEGRHSGEGPHRTGQ